MRRSNGVTIELARGVERLDFRYSLIDASGLAHWLTAAEVTQSATNAGAHIVCEAADVNSMRPCDWFDVNAVEVSMLVNSVDDLPANTGSRALDYRYSVDGNQSLTPAEVMPVTGLPAGRMLRREFQSVVALGNAAK